jgi:hypothetical protein
MLDRDHRYTSGDMSNCTEPPTLALVLALVALFTLRNFMVSRLDDMDISRRIAEGCSQMQLTSKAENDPPVMWLWLKTDPYSRQSLSILLARGEGRQ